MRAPCPASITLALTILAFAAFTSAQEHVSFPAPDGYHLNGDLYGHGNRAVVLVHGGRFNKESWEKQARVLADSGFRVLAIDFRGYGQTKAGTNTTDDNSYPDVLTAVRYLHSTGSELVSIVGASMGGDATADAVMAERPGEVDRVIFLASDGGDAPERLKVRKLFIVSRADESADGPRLPGISEHYRRAPEPKKLVILEGSAHAQFIFDTDQGARLMEEMQRFLFEP
ncbi:MAG: alpha/beta fold hydrolase [Terriglobales bacterium]|jgi:pimeloyl-ACP methyl ester carboxylesterase